MSTPLPSLSDVPAAHREVFARLGGWYIFFGGRFRCWVAALPPRVWQAECVALDAFGKAPPQIARGGDVMSGCERWEAVAP